MKTYLIDTREQYVILSVTYDQSNSSVSTPNPTSVKRTFDGETFSIGDVVTTGECFEDTLIGGKITKFEALKSGIFVTTTWSGIAFNLGSLSKMKVTPSKFQYGEKVTIDFPQMKIPIAWITKVHVSASVQYDISLNVQFPDTRTKMVRMHNIPEELLVPYQK